MQITLLSNWHWQVDDKEAVLVPMQIALLSNYGFIGVAMNKSQYLCRLHYSQTLCGIISVHNGLSTYVDYITLKHVSSIHLQNLVLVPMQITLLSNLYTNQYQNHNVLVPMQITLLSNWVVYIANSPCLSTYVDYITLKLLQHH